MGKVDVAARRREERRSVVTRAQLLFLWGLNIPGLAISRNVGNVLLRIPESSVGIDMLTLEVTEHWEAIRIST